MWIRVFVCVLYTWEEFACVKYTQEYIRECARFRWRKWGWQLIHFHSMLGRILVGDRNRISVASWLGAQKMGYSLVVSLGLDTGCAKVATPFYLISIKRDALTSCRVLARLFASLEARGWPRARHVYFASFRVACTLRPDLPPWTTGTCKVIHLSRTRWDTDGQCTSTCTDTHF